MRGIWVTWENQIRNRGISSALGFDLYEIVCDKNPLWRYLISSFKTISITRKTKPDVIVVQNPSIALALLGLLLKRAFGCRLVVDAHYLGIYPLEGRSQFLTAVSKVLQRGADLTLITNDRHRGVVSANGGRAFVLPDRLPADRLCGRFPVDRGTSIAYICSFQEDEPYIEVIEAARQIPKDICIYFTGNHRNRLDGVRIPENVRLLGFLPEEEYWSLLSSCDLIMDLTKWEWCLVCGAYEGCLCRSRSYCPIPGQQGPTSVVGAFT